MKASEIYLKLLRWGIFASLFIPLIIFSQYLSPFHFGKMIIFRSLVEILAVIYILLIVANKKYLPRFTPIVISFTIFTGLYALTSFTGVDFNYSFWGTLERMGGLFSFLHFWVFFIILVSVFREQKDWEKLLKISIFVGFLSILFAYGQHFKLGDFFMGWQREGRVIGTIGNAALFAGYLLFVLYLAMYFLLRGNTQKIQKIFFGLILILGAPVLHMTAVRGSIIAFWGGLFLLGLLYLLFSHYRKIKPFIFAGLIVLLILIGFIWINKDSDWVKNISWLKRITDISLETRTLQTRLWSWQSGWQGFKEKPILGWGPENFVLAHAKHFDPRHFTQMGAETIWDRAHNMVLEVLVTMGVIGLLSYLGIFVAVYWLLIRSFKKNRIELAAFAVFGTMLAVYFFHNLFIFDTTVNYLMFFLVLGYLDFRSRLTRIVTQNDPEKTPNPILIFVLAILAVLLIFKTNIEPAKANYATTRAILAERADNGQKAFAYYQKALRYKSPQGKYEIRHKLAAFAFQYNQMKERDSKLNRIILDYTIEQIKKNIESRPKDYIPYLYLGRIYIILISEDPQTGERAEEAINKALEINDKNPRVWHELGQAKLSQKKYDEAVEAFKQALELNPDVAESNWFLGMAYAQVQNIEEAVKYVDEALKKGYNYKNSLGDILRLVNLYIEVGDYYKIIELYKIAIELQPENAQFYASLAAAYKVVGDIENAIFYAGQAGEIDESFKKEAEAFIKSLK